MAKLQGFNELASKLQAMAGKKVSPSVVVGVMAKYALFVHENLEAHHVTGQAKFLEEPARLLRSELAEQVARDAKNMRLDQALFRAGLKLQREMMPLIPIDTGNLRASSFTKIEKEGTPDLGKGG